MGCCSYGSVSLVSASARLHFGSPHRCVFKGVPVCCCGVWGVYGPTPLAPTPGAHLTAGASSASGLEGSPVPQALPGPHWPLSPRVRRRQGSLPQPPAHYQWGPATLPQQFQALLTQVAPPCAPISPNPFEGGVSQDRLWYLILFSRANQQGSGKSNSCPLCPPHS